MRSQEKEEKISEWSTFLAQLDEFRDNYRQLLEGIKVQDAATLLAARAKAKGKTEGTSVTNMSNNFTKVLEDLEKDIGLPLLTTSKPRQPTNDGKALLRGADRLFDYIDRLRHLKERRTVYISAIDMAVNFWIPEALGASDFFKHADHQGINLQITVREWQGVISDVSDGQADFGVGMSIEMGGVERTSLLRRPHLLLVRADSPLVRSSKSPLPVSELKGARIACLKDFAAIIDVESTLRDNGVSDVTWIHVTNSAQLLSFVRHGVACAFVTPDAVPTDGSVRAVPVQTKEGIVEAHDAIYTRKASHEMTVAARAVRDCILNYWSDEKQWLSRRQQFIR